MAAPLIAQTTRYINPATTKLLLVPSIADITAVTRSEMDAGLDVTREVAEVAGWMLQGEAVPTPDLATLFTGSITGRISVENSSITFYMDRAGDDIRSLSGVGTNTNVLWLDGGDVAGYLMDVYPVRVLSAGKSRSVEAQPGRMTVSYSVTREPAVDVEIPA
ncbi:hypothetical protein MF672_010880 [Actinomadura sp. ATCC 31491]|uniref:Uncharacterized protein n=1 Tax=Actinomadura luzonensis TaxID=2805427 RepID=A0ABT0FQV5_9ACTN|nr:hypothetical protein [Actinomadura luzonensis]MCK2214291.1 hypothetical protein [Actinomadura luzonensis]